MKMNANENKDEESARSVERGGCPDGVECTILKRMLAHKFSEDDLVHLEMQ